MSAGLLLDTHALIWIVHDKRFDALARQAVLDAAARNAVFVSAATAWELGFISTKPELAAIIGQSVRTWFRNAVDVTRSVVLPLDAEVLLDIPTLPMPLHRDPADRMLIATARARGLQLVTRDRAILDYAALGHVRAIAC